MAKKTKDSNLSIEERLEQALIPNWDEPYKLPENWCWSKLGSVSELYNGDRGANYPSKRDYVSEGIPFINAGAIQNNTLDETEFNFISKEKYEALRAGKIKKDDILYCLRGSLGKTALIATNLTGAISSSLCIIRAKNNVIPKYLFYLLRSNFVVQQQIKAENGSAQPNLSAASVMEYVLPIAPLEEQKRIISRVESLFSKLDETQEKAQEVVDGYESRKAAILHKAFSGELTAKWREENDAALEDWTTYSLSKCCKIGSGGTPSRKNSEYYMGDIPWIKTGEIEWNEVVDSEEKISQEAIDNSSAKMYDPGAVLVAMYGMGVTRGRAAILGVKAATNQAVCVLQPKEYLNNRYLFYFFMCNYWSVREQAVGGNQLNLSATIIGKLNIHIPSVSEQMEIVRVLDNLISKEQVAKETAEAVIEQIDTIKKAILARAFRGELGTNDPSEESAVELLKKVLSGGEN